MPILENPCCQALAALPRFLLLAGVCVLAPSSVTHGQILVAWDVAGTGNPADPTLTAGTITANLEMAAPAFNTLSRTDVIGANANNSFSSTNWNTGAFNQNTNYISFTVLASSGFETTFTSLDYNLIGGGQAPGTGQWGYSIGGGAFVMQPSFTLTSTSSSLSTWDFADFSTTQSVEWRFWAYGSLSIGGGVSTTGANVRIQSLTGNDLILNGTVAAVPEPGAAGLALLGATMLAWRGRRHAASPRS